MPMPPTPKRFFAFQYIYPCLLGLYPLIALWAVNLGQVPGLAVLRSVFFAIGLLALTWSASWLVFRDGGKAALACCLGLTLFYSFGQVYLILGGPERLQYRVLLSAWGLILAGGLGLIARVHAVPRQVHIILLCMALFLVLFPGGQILLNGLSHPARPGEVGKASTPPPPTSAAAGPDVYYILIDNYSRADLLKQLGYDNSAFVHALSELGFVVDPCAQSNYDYTHSSMAATLNMNYLEQLGVPIYPELETEKVADFAPLIQESKVREQFAALGYRLVTFWGVYPWLNIPDSDVYINPQRTRGWLNSEEAVNFQYVFLRSTLLRPAMDWLDSAGRRLEKLPAPVLTVLNYINPRSSLFLTREYSDYQNNLFALAQLAELPKLPGKKFIYAHIFPTHVPFVFNADGSLRAGGAEDTQSYLQAVAYTNTRLLEIVKTILRDSAVPPVIILQGDHGFVTTPARVKILNAFYFPGAPGLHADGVTPVNTFRLVFSHYFGLDYPLLPDQSYDTPRHHAYLFNAVPPSCAPK
jgi:hypothetical protein